MNRLSDDHFKEMYVKSTSRRIDFCSFWKNFDSCKSARALNHDISEATRDDNYSPTLRQMFNVHEAKQTSLHPNITGET